MDDAESLGWLADVSVEGVRAALAAVAPDLAGETIVLGPRLDGQPPLYWRGTARVGSRFVAKFAWSAEAAVGVERELRILALLKDLAPALPVPEVVAASRDPLLFVTRYVPGVDAGQPYAEDTSPSAIPDQLAGFLAALHDPQLRDDFQRHRVPVDDTRPQSTPSGLRERFAGPIVRGERARRVLAWCDWIEDVQRHPLPETTVVHGDLHAHNLVVSEDGERLLLVADFENAAIGDPHYDFRYLVSIRHDLDWFRTCRDVYERRSGRTLAIERILAWHILTALGDATWRTERGVPLPGGLTPDGYVDDITRRLDELGCAPTGG